MKLVWSKLAKIILSEIFIYYKKNASIKVARSIQSKIFKTTNKLKTHPRLGQILHNYNHSGAEYRFLVSGNYKILYRVDSKYIYISDIFDTRQEPSKITKFDR